MAEGQRLLVTGASGFIGKVLVRRAVAAGIPVRAALRAGGTALQGCEIAEVGDIGEEVDWERHLAGIDAVIHLAGRAHMLAESASDPLAAFCQTNVEGTRRLALAAASVGVRRLVFVSSIGVLGEVSQPEGFTEQDTPAPRSPYAVSKWEAEQMLTGLKGTTQMEITIVRPPLVYGPDAPGNLAALRRLIERGLPLPLASVRNQRTLVGVGNLADFLLRCAEHPQAAGELFLVGDAESVSTPDLVRAMARAMNRPLRLAPFPSQAAKQLALLLGKQSLANSLFGTLVVDSTKARTQLEWEQPFLLEEGLRGH